MPTVTVEVADLSAASRQLNVSVAEPLLRLVGGALDGIMAGGGMAGDDPAGAQWASDYDSIAPSAIQAAEDVINSCYRVSAMLGATARNYAQAEAASTVRGHHVDPHITSAVATLPDDTRIGLPSAVPSAAGGGSGGPPGWHFIADRLGGLVWPNGHQDRLRATARAWTASAQALDDYALDAVLIDIRPLVDGLREGPDISTVCNALSGHLQAVACAHRGLAHACTELAGHIDNAHSRIEHELVELLAWTGGIQAVGAVASIFSFGTAEGPTQAGQAARIAATALKVIAILRDFMAAVQTVLAEIAPLAGAVADVRAAVAWLKDLRIVQVEVSAVPGLRVYQVARVERTGSEAATTTRVTAGEEAALDELAVEASTAGTGRARWTSGKKLREHFAKHKKEFEYETADDYADAAAAFYDRAKAEGLPMKVDEEGDMLIYDESSNTFGVYTETGKTRTMFKPRDGIRYWNEQRGTTK
ncbi:hypothetical protein [uncultured Jatrophihabitans sp.]|uniref:hypothetical protein n=1 Tax=uncultured Jatrophihabitans sp. TaxID=1610747 RepID=UPI0035C9CB69